MTVYTTASLASSIFQWIFGSCISFEHRSRCNWNKMFYSQGYLSGISLVGCVSLRTPPPPRNLRRIRRYFLHLLPHVRPMRQRALSMDFAQNCPTFLMSRFIQPSILRSSILYYHIFDARMQTIDSKFFSRRHFQDWPFINVWELFIHPYNLWPTGHGQVAANFSANQLTGRL